MKSKFFKKTTTVILTLCMLIFLITPPVALKAEETQIGGDGTVLYPDLDDVFRIIIPTNTMLDFTLDPMGLSILTDGGPGMTLEEMRNSPAAGRVHFNDYTPVVVNESTFEVLVNFDAMLTGDTIVVESPAEVNTGTPSVHDDNDPNLYIGMRVSAVPVNQSATASSFNGTVEFPITNDNQEFQFVLEKGTYLVKNVSGDYIYEFVENSGKGTQLYFSGRCNPYGDWSSFIDTTEATKTSLIGITAIFTFKEFEGSFDYIPGTYRMVRPDSWTPPDVPPTEPGDFGFIYGDVLEQVNYRNVYPELVQMQAQVETYAQSGVRIPFNFDGHEDIIERIAWYNNPTVFIPTRDYVPLYNENTIVIDFTGWPVGGPEGYNIWIKLTNGWWYILWVVIQPNPIPP